MSYERYAIYYLPGDKKLAAFGASWLGWNVVLGVPVAQPDVPDIADATERARRYGFHATLKPPFRIAEGFGLDGLRASVAKMAANCPVAKVGGLEVTRLGSFLALVPKGDTRGVETVAETCVTSLDRFRRPPEEEELNRRLTANLTERQEELLLKWGYPYVLDQFRFHMTLTGRLPKRLREQMESAIRQRVGDGIGPFQMTEIALVGERQDGFFELIERFPLMG